MTEKTFKNKTIGLKLVDEINYLYQLNLINNEEKNEFAQIVLVAMRPKHETSLNILRNKLKQLLQTTSDQNKSYIQDVLAEIPHSI